MTAPSRALPIGERRSLRLARRNGDPATGNRLRRGIFSQAVHFDIRFADGNWGCELGDALGNSRRWVCGGVREGGTRGEAREYARHADRGYMVYRGPRHDRIPLCRAHPPDVIALIPESRGFTL